MRRHFLFLLAMALPLLSPAQERADFNVVPKPRQCVEQKGGDLALSSVQAIVFEGDDEMRRNASFLAGYVGEVLGTEPPVRSSKVRGTAITLRLNKKMVGEEAYRITVDRKGAVVEGATPQAVFRGVQTLRKALPPKRTSEVLVPAVVVARCWCRRWWWTTSLVSPTAACTLT